MSLVKKRTIKLMSFYERILRIPRTEHMARKDVLRKMEKK